MGLDSGDIEGLEYFERVDPVDQVGYWNHVDKEDSLYKWVREGGRFSLEVLENGEGYEVDYQDSEEIVTAIAFSYHFEDKESAFHYAQDFMYGVEKESDFPTGGENLS